MKRNLLIGATFVAVVVMLGFGQARLVRAAAQSKGAQAPIFEVDPLWPKPMPNHWLLGSTIGVWVDDQEHVWIIHRSSATLNERERGLEVSPPTGECCAGAPPVLEFDQAGNLLRHWGGPGPGYEWPSSEHGIFVDYKDNVWLAGAGGKDAQVLKFTQDGKFLLQIGHRGRSGGSSDTENLGRPADVAVDPETNEVYVADGYGNHRGIVVDADTGAFRR